MSQDISAGSLSNLSSCRESLKAEHCRSVVIGPGCGDEAFVDLEIQVGIRDCRSGDCVATGDALRDSLQIDELKGSALGGCSAVS